MAKPNNKPRVTGPDGIDYGALPVVGTLPPLLGPAPAAPEDEAKKPKSMVASVIDSGVAIGRGAVAGVKMFSDMVDPAGETSVTLQDAQDWLTSKESPRRRAQREARAKKIKDAELSGSKLKEIGAYLGTLADAPVDTVLEGLATSAPTLGLALIPGAGPAAVMARAGTMAAAGAGQGVGAARGRIYEDVQRAELANGATPEQAQQRAAQAAQLTGPNGDQIALAGGLGALASTTGAERAVGMLARGAKPGVTPGVAARVLRGGLAQGSTEAAQGSQEQFASNLAQQRAGFDTPLSQGVAGSAALEGTVGSIIGGGFALPRPRSAPPPATFTSDATQPTGSADQPTATPGAGPSPTGTMADPEQALAAMHREANDNLAAQKVWSRNNDRTTPAPDPLATAAAGGPRGSVDSRGSATGDAGLDSGLAVPAGVDPANADLPAGAAGQSVGLPGGQSAADLAESIDWTHKTPQLNTPEAAQRQATRQNERTAQQWVVVPHPKNPEKWGVFPVKPQAKAAAPAPVEPTPAPAPAPAIPKLEDLPTPSNDQRFVLQSRIDADRKQLAATSPDSKTRIKALRQAIATNEQALAALDAPPAAPAPAAATRDEAIDQASEAVRALTAAQPTATDADKQRAATDVLIANMEAAPDIQIAQDAPKAVEAAQTLLKSSVPGAEIVQGNGQAKGKVMARLGNETSNMHDTVEQADAELRQTLALREKQANEAKASQAFDEAAKRNPLPDWTTVDGVLALRSGQSRFVGVPRNGKKDAGQFDVIDTQSKELVTQLKRNEVYRWLWVSAKVETEQSQAEQQPEDLLSSYSADDLRARQDALDAAERKRADEEKEAERKAKADAERDTFTLTGSDRPADVAASQGQQDIFGAASEQPSASEPKPGKFTLIDVPADTVRWMGFEEAKSLKADLAALQQRHSEYYDSPSQVERDIAFVLEKPDGWFIHSGDRVVLFREKRGEGAIPTARIEVDASASTLQVRSVYVSNKRQLAKKMADKRKELESLDLGGQSPDALTIAEYIAALSKGSSRPTAPSSAAIKAAPSVQPPAPDNKQPPAAPIGDFGQKIGGARKDTYTAFTQGLAEVPDADIASQPLSKVWPEPDYQALLDGGADPWAVAFAHAARDEVPTSKPRQPRKLRAWTEKVKALRQTTADLMAGSLSVQRAQDLLSKFDSAGMQDLRGRIDLYQAVGHGKSLYGVRLAKGEYIMYGGEQFDPPKIMWTVEKTTKASVFGNWPRVFVTADTREQAIEKFKAKIAALDLEPKSPAQEVSFDIFSRRDQDGFWIGKKVGRNVLWLAGPFASIKEARAHKTDRRDELVQKLEAAKQVPSERRDINNPRVGEDMRGGVDVTSEMFDETFGFRGVEFGNWVEQARRQQDLNDAFDALMDMAAIIGVPPRALSLNGELGLAFGARGKGGGKGLTAAAHYERDKVVINLTKKAGAGSLGHEWWHALDNYFARMRKQPSSMMTESGDVKHAGHAGLNAAPQGVRPEVVAAFARILKTIRQTAIKARSAKLDGKRTKEYWTTNAEMSARAFESYLISKLHDQNASNDYLANIVDEKTWEAAAALGFELEASYPYPTAGEVPAIRAAFDEFFQTVETRATDQGVQIFEPGQAYNAAEPGAQPNADTYSTDLFGEPLPEAIGKPRAARSKRAAVPGDVGANAALPADTKRPAGEYLQRTAIGISGMRELGRSHIHDYYDLAAATAYLSSSAVERLDGVVTDADGKVLAIVGGFKGAVAQAAVYLDTMMAEAIRIPGAANLWLSHNHPSGTASLSMGDLNLMESAARLFDPTGIKVRGIAAVAIDKFSFAQPAKGGPTKQNDNLTIGSDFKKTKVPSIERIITQQAERNRPAISNPSAARQIAAQAYAKAKQPVILFLDAQLSLLSVVPIPADARGQLKYTEALRKIYRASAETTTGAAIIAHGGELDAMVTDGNGKPIAAAINIASAIQAIEVRALDIITIRPNSAPSSLADSGLNVTAPVWYSLRNAPNPELTALRFAGEVLLELSNNAGAFAFPISKSRTVQGVVQDIQPEFTYEGNVAAEDERNESGADEKHAIRNTAGKEAFIYLTKGEVWIDVSRFKPGQGGQAIYAMAGDLAKNTGRVFIGDPAGLSTDALRRRTEAMLSSAFRHGTTAHLEPHENQTKGDPAAGVKPLKWRAGDDAENIESLIGATLDNLRATLPEIDDYEFDFNTGQFRSRNDKLPYQDEAFEIEANRSAGARAALAGSRTLKRAAFIQSLLRAPSESRPQLLEFALRSNDSQLGLLRGLFSLAKRGRTAAPATDKESLTVDQALAPLRQSLILDAAQRGFDPVGLEGLKVASMTAEQRSLTKRLSSLFGIDIVLVDGDQGLAPEQQFNGVFAGGKTLYVSATAEKPFQWVVGHEFTHYMRLRSPALYDAMLERLAPYLRAQAVQRYAKAKMAGLAANAPLDRGIEEAMGDLMGDAWVRPEFWATLRTHDESLFQQVARLFREFVAALRRALGATTKPQGVAADLLKDAEAALEVLRSVVADAALPAAGPQPSAQPATAARSGGLGPLWVSELRRQIAAGPKAQPAEQWANWLKGLGSKGVKPDEIEWSGIPEFLELAQGKVTREQLLGVLNDEGVDLLDTVNNVDQYTGPEVRSARQRARDRLEYEGIQVSFEQGLDVEAGPDIEVAFKGTTFTFDADGHAGPWFYDAGGNSLLADAGQLVSDAYGMGLSADETGLEFSGVFAGRLEPRTQYASYTMPGAATNYQEILIRMPGRLYSSSHWEGRPNVLAHVRVDTRVDADGKKVLFVNEIQSDWAQDGRKHGFGSKAKQVNSAPFIKTTDKWVGLAIKRIIREAAEQRVDKVAFISGEQAAELYNLDKRVSKITAHRWDIEGYGPAVDLKVFDLDGQQIYNEDAASLEQVERLLGKDLAEKIAAIKPGDRQQFTGEALRFGGRGMKEFYDTIVPKVAKEVLRKLGNSSLDKTVLPASKPAALVFDTQGADARTLLKRADLVIVEGGAAPEIYGFAMLLHRNRPLHEALEKLTIESAERLGIKAVRASAPLGSEAVSFDMTPALRERALAGMPLFSSRAPAPQFSLRGKPADDKNLERNPAGTSPKTLLQHTTDAVSDLFTTTKKFNWWHKTVGTQAHKAKVDPQHYGRTFDLAIEHYNDVSRYANEAADLAPDLLPRLDGFGDLFKRNLSDADRKAIAAPIFDGTLKFKRAKKGDRAKGIEKGDVIASAVSDAGLIWTDAELKKRYNLNDAQIGYYKQFRAAVDRSIHDAVRADIIRFTADKAAHFRADLLAIKKASDVAAMIREEFTAIADLLESSGDPQGAKQYRVLISDVYKKLKQANRLSARGYAPLMRFGRYAVDILSKQGEREGFMLYESEAEANRAARAMRKEYPESDIVQSILSEDAYKLFSGASLETIELMATLSNDQDGELMQAFIKEARANHSAIKRLLHRKGIEGYSEDITRVLSSFLTSQARATSNMLHMGELTLSVKEIPQHKGDVKDEAAKLVRYIQDPQEEAQTLRGILFIQFIGGSVASALTNMTQPLTMTFPYLAKFGGAARASGQLLRAMKDIRKGATLEPGLKEALKRAETEGVVSPQEIHQLQAEAMRTLTGRSGKARRLVRKGLWLWGSLFSLAEQFNRRVTFIAAYRTAQAQGIGNPFAFAEQAIYNTQGIYNKVNRPNWARGAIGGTVFTFKQFSIAYMEFLAELPRPQKALALAVLMLAAGMQGLPGADDLDDIIDTIAQRLGYAFNSKQAKREFIVDTLGASPWVADFVLRGFSAIPGVPIDVQARMGLGNIIPGTGLGLISKPNKTDEVFEVLGPAGGLVRNVTNKGAEGLWPVAMANAKKGWDMYQTGMYRDEGGRRVMDTDGFDAAMKALGFQPAEVGRASATVRTLNQTIMLAKQMEARFASDIAGAIFERDAQAAKDARQRLAQWNKDNPETPIRITEAQINKRVMEMRATRDERFIKRTPRELRAGVERALRATGEEATAE